MFLLESQKKTSGISYVSNADNSISSISENIDKLKEQLKQESKNHKEISQCYSTLQQEYDKLLQKHAEAENTIDAYRIKSNRKVINKTTVFPIRSKSVLQLSQNDSNCIFRTYSLPNSCKTLKKKCSDETVRILILRLKDLQEDIQNIQDGIVEDLFDNNSTSLLDVFEVVNKEYKSIANELQILDNKGKLNSLLGESFDECNNLEIELYKVGLRLKELYEDLDKHGKLLSNENDIDATEMKTKSKLHASADKHVKDIVLSGFNDNEGFKMIDEAVDARYLSQSFHPVDQTNDYNPVAISPGVSHLQVHKVSESLNPKNCSVSTEFTQMQNDINCCIEKSSTFHPLNNTEDSGFIEGDLIKSKGSSLESIMHGTYDNDKYNPLLNSNVGQTKIDKDFTARLLFLKDFMLAKRHVKEKSTYTVEKPKWKSISKSASESNLSCKSASILSESNLSCANEQISTINEKENGAFNQTSSMASENCEENLSEFESPLKKLHAQVYGIYNIVQSMRKSFQKSSLSCKYSNNEDFFSEIKLNDFDHKNLYFERTLKEANEKQHPTSNKQFVNEGGLFGQQIKAFTELSDKVDELANKLDNDFLCRFKSSENEKNHQLKMIQKLEKKLMEVSESLPKTKSKAVQTSNIMLCSETDSFYKQSMCNSVCASHLKVCCLQNYKNDLKFCCLCCQKSVHCESIHSLNHHKQCNWFCNTPDNCKRYHNHGGVIDDQVNDIKNDTVHDMYSVLKQRYFFCVCTTKLVQEPEMYVCKGIYIFIIKNIHCRPKVSGHLDFV